MTEPLSTVNSLINTSLLPVTWHNDAIRLLDQRYLPDTVNYHTLNTLEQVVDAIQTMQVRGAPAIGITAAYGVVLAARQRFQESNHNWKTEIQSDLTALAESRPTAVNLNWALNQMRNEICNVEGDPESILLDAAIQIHQSDQAANLAMADFGAELLAGSSAVLTHCNAGALATGGYGTALGVIRRSIDNGLQDIYATETRPWSQGARLTVWELQQDGIPSTLISDLAAGYLMQLGKIDWIVVGADRITANGDTANKIGTYALACLAKQHQVKFMVVAPTSTIDWDINNGQDIPIEQRTVAELLPDCYQNRESLVSAWNPVFDVTPADLIDAVVTEKGVVINPNHENMQQLRYNG
ncbi:MAG: S-methyl-5-thioribose-1-phosphate isomerase [Gammaproteobacteria bacterium]|nr:S-methyl-5-thioribose-1-phosphate isomerase [Gammaproteobacteria bacterium]